MAEAASLAENFVFAPISRAFARSASIIPGRAGDGGDLAHAGIEIGGGLDGGGAQAHDGGGGRKEFLPNAGDIIPDVFQLFALGGNLLDGGGGLVGRRFQALQFLLGLNDFALQGVVLLLANLALRQRVVGLLRRRFQGFQLLLSFGNGIRQQLVLLR